jgi:hypothetical protein
MGDSGAKVAWVGAVSEQDDYITVSLDDDPNVVAQTMFDAMLPADPLDGTDPSGEGWWDFIANLMLRIQRRALERDEIITIVERHRAAFEANGMITEFANALESVPDDDQGAKSTLLMTLRNMEHALNHRLDRIDAFSNRLLYLCIALDMKIRSGRLSHDEAVRGWLDLPATRELMSPLTIRRLVVDYEQVMSRADDDRPTYVMLLAECALLASDTSAVHGFSALLGAIPPPEDHASWLGLRRRLAAHLAAHGRAGDHDDSLARAERRFQDQIDDDDL